MYKILELLFSYVCICNKYNNQQHKSIDKIVKKNDTMKPKLVIRFESLSCSITAQSLSLINPVGVILPGRVASFAILLYAIANSASMMSR